VTGLLDHGFGDGNFATLLVNHGADETVRGEGGGIGLGGAVVQVHGSISWSLDAIA
jgi:hypothetical protein